MKNMIFEYRDYKPYLNDLIESQPQRGRGLKSKLAHFMGCQTAYVSQVLSGPADFSLEQADKINQFFSHGGDESEFFLNMVLFGRAGTPSLKNIYKKKLESAAQAQLNLKKRVSVTKVLSQKDQAVYISQWYYVAVNFLLIDRPDWKVDDIALYLGIPKHKVTDVIDFLVSTGLINRTKKGYESGKMRMHLGLDSPFLSKHHVNWRLRAIQSLDRYPREGRHYSAVVSISKKDAEAFDKEIVEVIDRFQKKIKKTKPEDLMCFTTDFFQVGIDPTRYH